MDILATFFAATLVIVSVGVTYCWGIKPQREEQKRRAEQIRAELRRQHYDRLRQRTGSRREAP